jgi:hypothetical protein
MNKGPIFWLLVALGLIAVIEGFYFVTNAIEGRRNWIVIATMQAGQELIEVTNATRWIRADSELRARVSDLLASPTHINNVLLGDDRKPIGDGHASSRLLLTNELGRGLAVRLRLRRHSGEGLIFDVLSYSKITEPGRAANRSQPIGSDTNRESGAAVSGR